MPRDRLGCLSSGLVQQLVAFCFELVTRFPFRPSFALRDPVAQLEVHAVVSQIKQFQFWKKVVRAFATVTADQAIQSSASVDLP
mgnify:CR=1 FL=1